MRFHECSLDWEVSRFNSCHITPRCPARVLPRAPAKPAPRSGQLRTKEPGIVHPPHIRRDRRSQRRQVGHPRRTPVTTRVIVDRPPPRAPSPAKSSWLAPSLGDLAADRRGSWHLSTLGDVPRPWTASQRIHPRCDHAGSQCEAGLPANAARPERCSVACIVVDCLETSYAPTACVAGTTQREGSDACRPDDPGRRRF